MGRAAKNYHRQLINGKDGSKYNEMPKAANDATAVARKPKPDNILSTMDKHGVTDIVRNMGQHKSPKEAQAEFSRLGNK